MKAKKLLILNSLLGAALTLQAQDVRQGLVSYWPLDELSGDWFTTPDVAGGNDLMTDSTFIPADVVPGHRGNAFAFNPDFSTRLWHYTPPGEDTGLPVTMSPTWTMMCWVNATYPNGLSENDRRAISTSSGSTDDPLVNIGTHNGGGDSNVDLFVRNSGTQVNHAHGTLTAYDGTWHHVALVDAGGELRLYVDGELDSTIAYTRGPTPMTITSIGAVVRQVTEGAPPVAASIAALFRGMIDDVAMWERALSQAEIQDVVTNGIQTPVPAFAPEITAQPVGGTDLIAGDDFNLTVGVTGSRPLNFQWKKNGANVPGATGATLTLTGLTAADSGTYSVTVSNGGGSVTSDAVAISVGDWPAADIERSLIAFWPLDEVVGTKTPDLVSGYDMSLYNLSAADLQPGKFGKAFMFSADKSTGLSRVNNPGEDLPIYNQPDWSVSMWVKGPIQTDRRVFSEGSTGNNNPLFNIGTHNTAADATVDSYIRTDTGGTANHQHGTASVFDDAWHQLIYVQRTVAGVVSAKFYVDGVEDTIVPQPVYPLTLNTTSIGAILRSGYSAHYTGLIDEVAIWDRALSPEEITQLQTVTITDPPPRTQPLAINSFRADFPAVVQGQEILLRWDVSKDASQVTITPDVGDVTGITTAGAGSVAVSPDQSTTYTITVSRGVDTLAETTRVAVVDGVAPNWVLLDNFDTYAPGFLADAGDWLLDTRGRQILVETMDDNRVLRPSGADCAAFMNLYSHTLEENDTATLFFRFVTRGNPAADIRQIAGLTDVPLRGFGDSDDNVGPSVSVSNVATEWVMGARPAIGGALEYSPNALAADTLYSVWIDITNVPKDEIFYEDTFTVYLQKDGDAGRTLLFSGYLSDRDQTIIDPVLPLMAAQLDKLFVSSNSATESGWFDDFYLSAGGFNSTVPRPPGFTGTPEEVTLSIGLDGGQVTVSWDSGTLQSAPAVTGPWSDVAGANPPSIQVTPGSAAAFYRARQ
ncbi:MAG: immunoglobulin domain-containing protein [Verrucomicrobiales bacterium]|nr:immunoglobulin domain-containing protein [Verrucomicrobiales bacterium]MCP5525587.1 immunoglobulin domain-containing protein [Verrucomicrobiales bacterium]